MDRKNKKIVFGSQRKPFLAPCLLTFFLLLAGIATCAYARYSSVEQVGSFQVTLSESSAYTYELVYLDRGGTVASFLEEDNGKTKTIPITEYIPVREGYEFLGWSPDPDSTENLYQEKDQIVLSYEGDGTTHVQKTFYAVWKAVLPILEQGTDFLAHTPSDTVKVIFTDQTAPEGAVLTDVSEAKDGGIMAWQDGTTMMVSTQRSGYPVYANPDSSKMFYKQTALTEIDTTNLNTSLCRTLLQCCFQATSLKKIDTGSFNVSRVTNFAGMFYECRSLTDVGEIGNWDTSSATDIYYMFYQCSSLRELSDLSGWNMAGVTSLAGIFCNCLELTRISGLDKWDISHVTDLRFAFAGVNATMKLSDVGDLSRWNTGKVTSFRAMFQNCGSLSSVGDLSQWDTSSLTVMNHMFYHCTSLTDLGDLSGWDTSHVTSFRALFCGNDYVGDMKIIPTGVENWDVSNGTNFAYMFYGCGQITKLDLSKWKVSDQATTFDHFLSDAFQLKEFCFGPDWDTSSVTTFDGFFNDCRKLKSLDVSILNTSSCTNMGQMFENCCDLTTIAGLTSFDTSACEVFAQMFSYCEQLQAVDLSSFNTENGLYFGYMFAGCKSLTTLDLSSFHTGKAAVYADDNAVSGFYRFLYQCSSLSCIKVSDTLHFTGDGSLVSTNEEEGNCRLIFPTPTTSASPNADGLWYNSAGESFAPYEIPDLTADTYYAQPPE